MGKRHSSSLGKDSNLKQNEAAMRAILVKAMFDVVGLFCLRASNDSLPMACFTRPKPTRMNGQEPMTCDLLSLSLFSKVWFKNVKNV